MWGIVENVTAKLKYKLTGNDERERDTNIKEWEDKGYETYHRRRVK